MLDKCIESLEWDSSFFGYPVARVVFFQKKCENIDDLFNKIRSNKFRLTYLFVSPEERDLTDLLIKKGAILADQRVTFSKPSEKQEIYSNSIEEFTESVINESLIELTLQAGIYSRFRVDNNFKNKEFEKLYIEWLKNSLNKTIAFKTLVSKHQGILTGFLTIGGKGHTAEIGLVSVGINFRGMGIGSDLIRSADSIAFDMGLNKIKVVTQLKNKAACRLYEKCNFNIDNITNIYHYWNS